MSDPEVTAADSGDEFPDSMVGEEVEDDLDIDVESFADEDPDAEEEEA